LQQKTYLLKTRVIRTIPRFNLMGLNTSLIDLSSSWPMGQLRQPSKL